MKVLGIETSCDETSAAVMVDGELRSNVISSHVVHQQYGGVVPELAARAHQKLIVPVVAESLRKAGVVRTELDGIAVTYGPGLMGALLVGLNFAKAMSYGLGIPLIGVNHLEAHIYSSFIEDQQPSYPFLCLIVSGGHTQLVLVREVMSHELLGETLDDAAGEAYDKVAKMLGLGFPGGPVIDAYAAKGDRTFVTFPRSYLDDDSCDFSFSGIKTSMLYWLRDHHLTTTNGETTTIEPVLLSNLCASFQAAVVDVLVEKTVRSAKKFKLHAVTIAGGVSANSQLRMRLNRSAEDAGFRLFIPKPEYCTDNAAMVAMAGCLRLQRGMISTLELSAQPNLSF